MANLGNPQETIAVLQKYQFNFQKKFGQNFLIDMHVLEKIMDAAGVGSEDCVLEIGPGIGTMTQMLAERAAKVIAVEIDNNLIPILQDTLSAYDNVKIIHNDILKLDLGKLVEEENGGKPIKVVANLPYYITSPIVMTLLESRLPIDSITVMVQKEAAERICADFGTRESGAISVAIRYYGKPRVLFNVSRGSFIPAPKVDSSVIKIDINSDISSKIKNKEKFFQIIKATYSKRRKNILNSLSMHFKISKEEILKILNSANVDPNARPEQLKLEDFINIADCV